MKIRIPAPINGALDAVERRQWVASTAVSVAAVLLLVVAALGAPSAAGIAAGMLLVLVLSASYRTRVRALQEQVRQRDYDLAAKDAEIARLSAGDATAPTAQFLTIGETGELT
jgi:ABC-type dipeptide/oligopeptide/nickel transport system permease subunit